MKTAVKLLDAFLKLLVMPVLLGMIGAVLANGYSEGWLHHLGVMAFWAAVIWAVYRLAVFSILFWLKRDEHKMLKRAPRRS